MGADALGKETQVRAFFGLPLPEAHKEALDRYIGVCAAVAPDFRWTPGTNLHVTIRFLGHVELALAEGVAEAVASMQPSGFELRLGQVGTFKRGRLARVVWLGVSAGEHEMAELARAVEAECVRAGLESEARRFTAHLTLARARRREGAPAPSFSAPPDLPAWRATELILYRSRLGRGGSVYEPLRTISLG
ncbi:MAG TPA: RNA 2',3'-cyclic phosphodiesterase [Candidatus Dormibacteraeota bacterium]|nr:RNA 2',3'-cyclic phosphodiesterase [Candidatus Dormibacteraeota bacterium]